MAYFIGISAVLLLFSSVAVEGVQLGANCTVPANCTSTVAHTDCTGTSTKTCTCVAGYVAKSDNTKCLIKFNGTCTNTADCLPNANCTSSRCTCNMNFRHSANGLECNSYLQDVQLGGNCTDSTSCIVTNSACTGTSTKTCTCVAGYVAKSDNAKCLVTFNGTCDNTTATECLPNATCTKTRCMCDVKFQPSTDGMTCSKVAETVPVGTTNDFIGVKVGVPVAVCFVGIGSAAGILLYKTKIAGRKTAVSSSKSTTQDTANSNGPQSQTSKQPQDEETA